MDKVVETSKNIIKASLESKVEFLSVIKKDCRDISLEEKSNVSSLCGYYFRHFYLLKMFLKQYKIDFNSDEGILIGLVFANNSLKHYVDSNLLLNDLYEYLSSIEFNDLESFKEDFNELILKRKTYEFKKITLNFLEHFSIRFNLPIWLVRMLTKQNGTKEGIGILKALSFMPSQFVSLQFNKKLNSNDDISNFELVENDLYKYNQKNNVKKDKLVFNGTFYLTQKDISSIFNNINSRENSNFTCYSKSNNNIIFDYLKKFYDLANNFYFVSSKEEETYQNYDVIRKMKLPKAHFIELDTSGLNTYSENGEDVILYIPKNSEIELFRRYPDYGLVFDPLSMDKIIKTIKTDLLNLIKFVSKEGSLIYFVPTINKKETTFIKDYLLNEISSDEFELVKEEMFLPKNNNDSCFYYFIIRRK